MKTNIENTQSLLHDFGISAKKTLGQNFLISQNVVDQIIEGANISNDDIVIEIGPGIGALSEEICKKAKRVYLFEIDSSFKYALTHRLKDFTNYKLIINDFLKVNIDKFISENEINQKVKIISNLPYYITSKLLLKMFKYHHIIKSITVMMQKDVGIKFNSDDNKEKSPLTMLMKLYANVNEVCEVSSDNFLPRPHVDSIVLNYDILEQPKFNVINEEKLEKILNALFTQRRKTITKSMGLLIPEKEKIEKILNECNIPLLTRVEQLDEEKIIELCNKIAQI